MPVVTRMAVDSEIRELEKTAAEVASVARDMGLDFGDVEFYVCPAAGISSVAAYGAPHRFRHWCFGKAYDFLRTRYKYNLHKIYELVLNTRPCKAFLLEGGSQVQSLVVMAHVLAHSDFFRHNLHFRDLPGDMDAVIAGHAERLRHLEAKHGRRTVERLLDALLAVQEQVDPGGRSALPSPERDLLAFLARFSPQLSGWQREVAAMVRREMLYFWPQITTRIAGEGWATYWHTRIVRRLLPGDGQIVEWARLQANLLRPSFPALNPYLIGLRLFESIARRCAAGSAWAGKSGRDRLFAIRETVDDAALVGEYLTPEVAVELGLFVYRQVGGEYVVKTRAGDWETVRAVLVRQLANGGFPRLLVLDGDYRGRQELYLRHEYDGRRLDLYRLPGTLAYIYELWGRPVHLETVLGGRSVVLTYVGAKLTARSWPE